MRALAAAGRMSEETLRTVREARRPTMRRDTYDGVMAAVAWWRSQVGAGNTPHGVSAAPPFPGNGAGATLAPVPASPEAQRGAFWALALMHRTIAAAYEQLAAAPAPTVREPAPLTFPEADAVEALADDAAQARGRERDTRRRTSGR